MQVLLLKKTLFFFLVSAHKQNKKKLKKIFWYSGCTALASYYLTWCRHFESLLLYVYNFSSDNPRTQRFLDLSWYQQEAMYECKLLVNLTVLKPHWSILEPRARSSLSTLITDKNVTGLVRPRERDTCACAYWALRGNKPPAFRTFPSRVSPRFHGFPLVALFRLRNILHCCIFSPSFSRFPPT